MVGSCDLAPLLLLILIFKIGFLGSIHGAGECIYKRKQYELPSSFSSPPVGDGHIYQLGKRQKENIFSCE